MKQKVIINFCNNYIMSTSSTITILGISIIVIYSLIKILEFYGINLNVYGSYISFYVFIIITSVILPREYPKLVISNK